MTTVLVIDDDQIIVDLLKMVVEDAGHEVVIASAMDRIPQQIAPDLILTDLIPLKSYRRDLAQFMEFCARLHTDPMRADAKAIRRFLAQRMTLGDARTSIARKASCLRT